jgi:hypothetical protein
VLVQAFIAQPPVEGFDVGVLVGLARLDQAQRNTLPVRLGVVSRLIGNTSVEQFGV